MKPKTKSAKLIVICICLFVASVMTLLTHNSIPSQAAAKNDDADDREPKAEVIDAQIVATGIPGAGAIMQVGTFQQGGPFRDNASFTPFTQPGAVLNHDRLLVASSSNFSAPLARPSEASGSILSLDVSNGLVAVPAGFASSGGQARALGGAVILYAANSPDFVNGSNNPNAITAALPAASLPRGISVNNGFGRPWFANAPGGSSGDGTITVIDGNGKPLAGAPDAIAGGVFAGNETNRSSQTTHGLTSAALATALITKSADHSGKAVFFAALADGSVVQVHVQKGVDGLAPAGSFTPIANITTARAESNNAGDVTRVGMLFNWAPTEKIFITDPLADRILVFGLNDDGVLFNSTKPDYLKSKWLDKPVDMAPATVEVAARNFASNTTLGVGSDLYVLNRGNNSIVRMTQNGKVVAVRLINCNAEGFRANGIATSPDARTIFVAGTTSSDGVVLKMPAFGEGSVTQSLFDNTPGGNEINQGATFFSFPFTAAEGGGPLFNGQSCSSCHNSPSAGGMGTTPETFVMRVAMIHDGHFDDLSGHGGPIARQFVNGGCDLRTGAPPECNATSIRSAMTLRGTSLLDFVANSEILKVQAAQPDAIRGRQNILADGRVGRFGWKAQTATLVEFMGEAMRDEIGLTNPIDPKDLVHGCEADKHTPESDAVVATALAAFLNSIDPPAPGNDCLSSPGAAIFNSIGCSSCHTPTFPGPGKTIRAYSDLLLHDMGPYLADGFQQGSATGNEFRTAPLWRVSERSHFLHDGRAATIVDAINAHGGQAGAAAAAFAALSPADRQKLIDFLNCL